MREDHLGGVGWRRGRRVRSWAASWAAGRGDPCRDLEKAVGVRRKLGKSVVTPKRQEKMTFKEEGMASYITCC